MAAMIRYDPEEWRLYMDSFVQSLKAVLLHRVKVLPSVPVALTSTKRKHGHMKEILSCMNYKTCQWHICGDLNVNVIVKGLQKGYTNSAVAKQME